MTVLVHLQIIWNLNRRYFFTIDGRKLLNYARFRKDDEGDYGRTKRQQQVMQAVMKQLKNPLSLFKGPEALGKVYSLTSTNMSMTDMLD